MAERQWGIGKRVHGETRSYEEILAQIIKKFPVDLEPRINTLARPVVLEVACPGWQPRMWPPKRAYPKLPPGYVEGGVRYRAVPFTIEDQVSNLVQAVKAGCAAIHVHARDPQDSLTTEDPNIQQAVFDGVFAQVDCITNQHTWLVTEDGRLDYVAHAKEMVERAHGNRYCQGAVVLWPPGESYPPEYLKSVHEAIEFFAEHKIKPTHMLRNSYGTRKLHRTLIETGLDQNTPHVLVHDMGHPYGWPMDSDPWMAMDMITSLQQTKERIPNSVIGVFSGGRNWLPITLQAILLGVDFLRVGIEDIYWLYPHKDEVIPSNIDCVNRIVTFCNLIGREIATPEQARQILGIVRTS